MSFLDAILKGEHRAIEEEVVKQHPSQEIISKLWKSYLEDARDKADPFFLSYASTVSPQWKSPDVIFFKLKSNIAQGALNNNKSQFITYLQKRLHVDTLVFESEVELDEQLNQPREAVTIVDRLKELQNSNPAVNLLIDKLGLDFYKND